MLGSLELNRIYHMDCLEGLSRISDGSVSLAVTSPPYYNARDYSHWDSFDDYMRDMRAIFTEMFRVLQNHRYVVINVGDVTAQVGKAKWAVKKLPLGAYFTVMMEEIGFQFVDDYIWDKGEPQSKRHLGNPPFPFYQYPVNCYEHILVFVKHVKETEKIPCPVCNETITQSNSQTGIGIQSWECKNPKCPEKSKSGRGKRFSKRSVMMQSYQTEENRIDDGFIKKWRRDIVRFNPVIKINSKGENIIGHPAPFPEDIPEMAIRYFSGVGDVVLDMFAGSGTTAVACIRNNRNYIGFETKADYIEIANKRVIDELKSIEDAI